MENKRQPIYDNNAPEDIYFLSFGDDYNVNESHLPYGVEIIDSNTDEIKKTYIDVIDNYIGTKVIVLGKESIYVL